MVTYTFFEKVNKGLLFVLQNQFINGFKGKERFYSKKGHRTFSKRGKTIVIDKDLSGKFVSLFKSNSENWKNFKL